MISLETKKPSKINGLIMKIGGSGEIRTHERFHPSAVFKTAAFNHSATLPRRTGIIHKSSEPVTLFTNVQAINNQLSRKHRSNSYAGNGAAYRYPCTSSHPASRRNSS